MAENRVCGQQIWCIQMLCEKWPIIVSHGQYFYYNIRMKNTLQNMNMYVYNMHSGATILYNHFTFLLYYTF